MRLVKTKLGALLNAKDKSIHELEMQLQQQMVDEAKKEKFEEWDVYIHMREDHYADQIAQLVLEKSEMHTKYEPHKAKLKMEKE